MWVYTLKAKSQACEAFKKFKIGVENACDHKVKTLRTDRGGEFLSKEFTKLCEDHGIKRHLTAPYTPQQNGVVERRNRTVMATARSLLKSTHMPGTMWGEAVRHAVYLLNRLPTKALCDLTPYEAWFGKKPHLEHLRIFGCIAHVKVAGPYLKKLDDRSTPMVYLGVEEGSKAHRLYDPQHGKVHVSRDVAFEEGKGWEWNAKGDKHPPGWVEFTAEEGAAVVDPAAAAAAATPAAMEAFGTPQTAAMTPENLHETADTPTTPYEPVRYRSLADIYAETEVVDFPTEELYLATEEPTSYREAATEPEWRKAMEKEMEAIEKNKTWVLMERPRGPKPIGLKWVYKLKKDNEGNIIKHKARLVAKGYVQRHGVDFDEVFAPVARLDTIRMILAVSAQRGWEVHHMDVKSAFLNGDLQEEVYVVQPEGFVVKNEEHKIYKLSKALYGLRQAPRAWNTRLDKCLKGIEFARCSQEQAVYTKNNGGDILIVGVYVDDLIVTGSSADEIKTFKLQMMNEFEMSDLGLLSYYLGIEVDQRGDGISLRQAAYAKRVLVQFGMMSCNPTQYPMEAKLKLGKDLKGTPVDATEYRRVIGCLRYLTHTRPDISYAVGIVSRYMEKPTVVHHQAVKHILRYVKGTMYYGLMYRRNRGNEELVGFTDSDLAGDVDDRRSTGGMAFYLGDSLVTWTSQKQKTVALSSCEAEFMAATAAACQGLWLRSLFGEVIGSEPNPVTLFVDNKSAIALMKNPVFHGRSKHIDTRFHFIRECVERGQIKVEFVCTNEQRADILTKALARVKFIEMRELLGVRDLQSRPD